MVKPRRNRLDEVLPQKEFYQTIKELVYVTNRKNANNKGKIYSITE